MLAGLAAAGVLVWALVLRDTAEPVSVDEVVAGFRSDAAPGGTGDTGVPVPEPGVYVYATDGFEEVDALLGSRHDYPAETTVTVTDGGCGLVLRWDALESRSTTWEVCPATRGWEIRGYDEAHRFLGRTERTAYRCDAGSTWRPAADRAGTAFARRCVTGETVEEGAGTVVGLETVAVAGRRLETVRLRVELTLTGRTRGTGTIAAWLERDTGLVVRLELVNDNRSRSAIGDVRYREQVSLALVTAEPRR